LVNCDFVVVVVVALETIMHYDGTRQSLRRELLLLLLLLNPIHPNAAPVASSQFVCDGLSPSIQEKPSPLAAPAAAAF
jgi:hypothetical protein